MSFNGDLEHFPLADVIQLLHMTSKTGILYLKSTRGESQLVFHEGFFVSANHLNNSVRIGKILVDMNAVSPEQLEKALAEQKRAGSERKPLIATLIEQGTIDRDTAFRGLESLIEMTIVEVLTWANGTFSLDVSNEYVSDEYRYFPEKLHQEILLNAQGVLMDSLRIYDEKMRDGTLSSIFFPEESSAAPDGAASSDGTVPDITADLLGLDTVDSISRKIPDVFIGLKDHNPHDEHRHAVQSLYSDAPAEQREQLVSMLTTLAEKSSTASAPPVIAVILLTRDELLSHTVTAVCKKENLFIFATDEVSSLDVVIEQSLGRDLHPVLLIDAGHDDPSQSLVLAGQKHSAFPRITVVLAACRSSFDALGMALLGSGAGSIIPRPCRVCDAQAYTDRLISYAGAIGPFLASLSSRSSSDIEHRFMDAVTRMKTCSEPPEIARALLQFAALLFERAITFVVAKGEIIAEKSIGVTTDRSSPPSPPLMIRLPLEKHSVFEEVVEKGRVYFGQRSDPLLTGLLYREISAPRSMKIAAVPLISRGRVIAVTYADFGSSPASPAQIHLLEALAHLAGVVLDNALYRKSIEKTA